MLISWQSIQQLLRHLAQPYGGARGKVREPPNAFSFIVRQFRISVPRGPPVNVEICHWTSENFDMLAVLEESSLDSSSGTMNVCRICLGNPSNSCYDTVFSLDQSGVPHSMEPQFLHGLKY